MVLGAEHWGMRNHYSCRESPASPCPTKSTTSTSSNKKDKLSWEKGVRAYQVQLCDCRQVTAPL